MIARVFAVCDILGGLDVQKLQQRVNFALHREEGFVLAVSAEDQVARLFGKILPVDRKIDSAQLIELDALVLHRVVAGENVQHARQDDRAHDGGVFTQRVDKLQGLAQGRVLRNADCVKRSGGDERVGDNLAVAQASCRSACLILEHRGLGIAAARRRAAHERGCNVIIPIIARDFLGDVCHAAKVGAPRGHLNLPVYHRYLFAGAGTRSYPPRESRCQAAR